MPAAPLPAGGAALVNRVKFFGGNCQVVDGFGVFLFRLVCGKAAIRKKVEPPVVAGLEVAHNIGGSISPLACADVSYFAYDQRAQLP